MKCTHSLWDKILLLQITLNNPSYLFSLSLNVWHSSGKKIIIMIKPLEEYVEMYMPFRRWAEPQDWKATSNLTLYLVWSKGPGIPIHPIADPLIKRLKHQEDKSLCLWSLGYGQSLITCSVWVSGFIVLHSVNINEKFPPKNKACHCSMSLKSWW